MWKGPSFESWKNDFPYHDIDGHLIHKTLLQLDNSLPATHFAEQYFPVLSVSGTNDNRNKYPKDCKIDPVDLCTILTNLLDNAMEACGKLPEASAKILSVIIRRVPAWLIARGNKPARQ